MTTLNEIAELVWRQIHPRPGDETSVLKAEVLASAKIEYAGIVAIDTYQKRSASEFELPSELINVAAIQVKKDDFECSADISKLPIIRAIPNDMWWVKLTGMCEYIKTTARDAMLISPDNTSKIRAYPVQSRIIFPESTPETSLNFYFAGYGNIEGRLGIQEEIGFMVRQKLEQIYLGKLGKQDLTNNSANDV